MSCSRRVPILSCAKITSIFFSECYLLVLPSTVLPEPYTSQHKLLVSISGTSLHFWLQRSRGHHRSLRATGCISNKWVFPDTIILVPGTHTALLSMWLEMPKEHWSEMSVTTLRLEIFLFSLENHLCFSILQCHSHVFGSSHLCTFS